MKPGINSCIVPGLEELQKRQPLFQIYLVCTIYVPKNNFRFKMLLIFNLSFF